MALTLSTLVIDCADPEHLADFWCAVLGWTRLGIEDDGAVEIGVADDPGPRILFEPVPEPKVIKNRLHLDLRPAGARQSDELERLLGLGAHQIEIGQGRPTWVVLADPEGNEFCLLQA
jgi:hypothetical protein